MALTDKLSAIADAIRAKTGKTEGLTLEQMPTEITSITGGGSAEGLVTVTFMNGDTELFSRPVYIGDDCPNPVDQNRIDTPTKESTAQYNYVFYGWGASDGGAADGNILKNITEDKTVYAVFTAVVRTYTITYYDEDGVTVLHTENLPYGTIPSYEPSKDGAAFDKWTPTPTAVTGNASYTAVWTEGIGGALTDTIVWKHDESTGVLTISGTGVMPNFATASDQPWRTYWQTIKTVIVEEGITALGERSFQDSSRLTSVSLPTTLRGEIPSYCFGTCSDLQSLTIPEGITAIGKNALYGIKGFVEKTDIILPQSLTTIGDSAFAYSSNLKEIDIPANVNSIGKKAFTGSTAVIMSLAKVNFANTTGWWVSTSATATSGSSVDVSSPSTAASRLTSTYKDYYWKRT